MEDSAGVGYILWLLIFGVFAFLYLVSVIFISSFQALFSGMKNQLKKSSSLRWFVAIAFEFLIGLPLLALIGSVVKGSSAIYFVIALALGILFTTFKILFALESWAARENHQ